MERDEVAPSSDRTFGYVFAAVFAIVAVWPLALGGSVRLWALTVAGAFLASAIFWQRALHPLNRIWYRIGLLLHHLVTPIVMGAIFLLGVLPTALIMRMLKKDLLRTGSRWRSESNWVVRSPPGPAPDSMKRLF